MPSAATNPSPAPASAGGAMPGVAQWAKVIDHSRCIGCHACSTACKSENEVPLGVNRTYVKYVDVGTFPQARRAFQVTRCNQCAHAPCVAACPYDAIFINPEDHSAEKCNFCAHRLDVGLEPACVVVCPTEAILIGDLRNPRSRVAQIVNREPVTVRRPEKQTLPKLFYKGAHQATLDPLAAARPPGGLFMWSQQLAGDGHVVSGHPGQPTSSAAAVLAYDVPHRIPWDWRVSLYTVTKAASAGAYLVALALVLFGAMPAEAGIWSFAAPVLGGLFLALTGGLLLSDLEHPKRFFMIFTRPQWRSWLVRGAFVILGYSLILGVHFVASALGASGLLLPLAVVGAPLAAMTAAYTAWLFAQARARDLWQSPLLPPHMLVQAVLAGAAVLLPVAAVQEPEVVRPLLGLLAGSTVIHLLFVLGETTLPHTTAHAALANHELTRGRWRTYFWTGAALLSTTAAATVAPMVAGSLSLGLASCLALAALTGLAAHEHAYVQAGQSVPLA